MITMLLVLVSILVVVACAIIACQGKEKPTHPHTRWHLPPSRCDITPEADESSSQITVVLPRKW